MERYGSGALPARLIRDMIAAGHIRNVPEGVEVSVSPSSLDVTLTDEIYRVEGIPLPRPGERVRELLVNIEHTAHSLRAPLERGVTYLAKLAEELSLPRSVYAYGNPKSTTGRNDVFVRILADNVEGFDMVTPRGFSGELWAVIQPKSYPTLIPAGWKLPQLRFFDADTRLHEAELRIVYDKCKLLWSNDDDPHPLTEDECVRSMGDGSLILTLDLTGKECVGWECLGSNKVLDFSSHKGSVDPAPFFRALPATDRLVLRAGGFYILYSRERVRVPPHLACEMRPMDARWGEFRSHYAGYIDPGWGWGADGEGRGRRLVLEVRPFEDVIMRDRQPVARIRFEHVIEEPELHYDRLDTSNYQSEPEIPKLAKQFRMP